MKLKLLMVLGNADLGTYLNKMISQSQQIRQVSKARLVVLERNLYYLMRITLSEIPVCQLGKKVQVLL